MLNGRGLSRSLGAGVPSYLGMMVGFWVLEPLHMVSLGLQTLWGCLWDIRTGPCVGQQCGLLI